MGPLRLDRNKPGLHCKICLEDELVDPVSTPCCNTYYCKRCIEAWLASSGHCPVDYVAIDARQLLPAKRSVIAEAAQQSRKPPPSFRPLHPTLLRRLEEQRARETGGGHDDEDAQYRSHHSNGSMAPQKGKAPAESGAWGGHANDTISSGDDQELETFANGPRRPRRRAVSSPVTGEAGSSDEEGETLPPLTRRRGHAFGDQELSTFAQSAGAAAASSSDEDEGVPSFDPSSSTALGTQSQFFHADKPPLGRYRGLSNQGATCYLNSLLQSLYMTPEFRNTVYRWDTSEEQDVDKSIPYQLMRLFGLLQTSNRRAVSTQPLTRSFGWDRSEAFEQHDVQELCRVLFEALETKFKGSDQAKSMENLYQGKLKDYVKCKACGYESARCDNFMDIALVIRGFGAAKSAESVEEALDDFVKTETLDGDNQYFCEKCNKKVDALKGLQFESFPYILTLQLKRFDFDYQYMRRIKLNDRVSFPFTLNLDKYVAPATATGAADGEGEGGGEGEHTGAEAKAETETEGANCCAAAAAEEEADPGAPAEVTVGDHTYELFSVMIHSGSALGGHYYAYIRSFADGRWCDFDDSSVTHVSEEDVKKAYGGLQYSSYGYQSFSSASAYMLFYRKKDAGRNEPFIPSPDLPSHVTNVLTRERELDELRRAREQEAANMASVDLIYHSPEQDLATVSADVQINRKRPVSDLVDIAREKFGLQTTVPAELCQLRKMTLYCPGEYPLEGLTDPAQPLYTYLDRQNAKVLLEVRASVDEPFPEYAEDSQILRVKPVVQGEVQPTRLVVVDRFKGTVRDVKDSFVEYFGRDPAAIRVITCRSQRAPEWVFPENKVLRWLYLSSSDEIFVDVDVEEVELPPSYDEAMAADASESTSLLESGRGEDGEEEEEQGAGAEAAVGAAEAPEADEAGAEAAKEPEVASADRPAPDGEAAGGADIELEVRGVAVPLAQPAATAEGAEEVEGDDSLDTLSLPDVGELLSDDEETGVAVQADTAVNSSDDEYEVAVVEVSTEQLVQFREGATHAAIVRHINRLRLRIVLPGEPDTVERWLTVDQSMLLQDFKEKIAATSVPGRAMHEFQLHTKYSNFTTSPKHELNDLDQTLHALFIKDAEIPIWVEYARALRPNEVLAEVRWTLRLPAEGPGVVRDSSAAYPPMFNLYIQKGIPVLEFKELFLAEIQKELAAATNTTPAPAPEAEGASAAGATASAEPAKTLVTVESSDSASEPPCSLDEKQRVAALPLDRLRVREYDWGGGKDILMDHERLCEDVMTRTYHNTLELCVEEMDGPEIKQGSDMVLAVRQWFPSRYELGPPGEIRLDSVRPQLEDLHEAIAEYAGLPVERVEYCRAAECYPDRVSADLQNSKWQPQDHYYDKLMRSQISEGAIFYYRDTDERVKELTEAEEAALKKQRSLRVSGSSYSYRRSPERGLKINVHQSKPEAEELEGAAAAEGSAVPEQSV